LERGLDLENPVREETDPAATGRQRALPGDVSQRRRGRVVQ